MNGAQRPRAHETVLVVDDDAGIREVLQEALESEGYDIGLASDGLAALAVVAAMTPSVILLDMWMPVMDGATFAQEYRRRHGFLAAPLICLAASDAARSALDIGAEGYLAKPFDLDDLLAIVAQCSHRPRQVARPGRWGHRSAS